jgi:hypothetical protein
MRNWVKAVLVLIVVGLALFFALRVVLIRSMEITFDRLQKVTTEVNAAGAEFGSSTTEEGCLAEMVRRVGGCDGDQMCGVVLSPFLWSCLEAVPRDPAFCNGVPEHGQDQAQLAWGRKTCARYGRVGDELCALLVTNTSAYCSTQ